MSIKLRNCSTLFVHTALSPSFPAMVSPSLIASVKLNLRHRPQSGTYGWLVDLINYFGYQGGFAQIEQCFQREDLTPAEMAALLAPVGRSSLLPTGAERKVNRLKQGMPTYK